MVLRQLKVQTIKVVPNRVIAILLALITLYVIQILANVLVDQASLANYVILVVLVTGVSKKFLIHKMLDV
jgi:hypothetical protein